MNEKPPMGDMRLQAKDILLPTSTLKEFSDIIKKPADHYHYRAIGDLQENREVFRVHEGDGIFSDYSFPEKSDMKNVQFVTRKTYTKEMNMLGKLTDYPVAFDKKAGTWKKLNVLERVKYAFSKEINIPAQVVDGVLHTLEQKRPVGESVKEAILETVQDAQIDVGLKYKHVELTLNNLKKDLLKEQFTNKRLVLNLKFAKAKIAALAIRLGYTQAEVEALSQQIDAANQANAQYEKPEYPRPDPNNVVDGKIVGEVG